MSTKTTPVSYVGKHVFTQEEKDAKLQQMLTAMRIKAEIEDELKTTKSTYKAKIDSRDAEIKLMSNLLNAGQEDRTFQCNMVLNFDLTRREYYEIGSGNLVGTEPLTAADYQTQLALDEQLVKEQNEQTGEHEDIKAAWEEADPDYSVDPFSDPLEMQEQPAEQPTEETPPAQEATVVNIDKPTKQKEEKTKTVEIEPTPEVIEDNIFGSDESEDDEIDPFSFDDI